MLWVQVHGVTKFCVFCTVTDLSDLEAIILKEDISSSEITDPSDRVRRGDTVNARWAAPHSYEWQLDYKAPVFELM